jgi:D-glycero-alpha-D-manno-heptose-7-phosphate kinase
VTGKNTLAFSPLRVSFAGGGTDISPFVDEHGGSVVNSTIERGVFVTYREDPYPVEISSRDFLKTFVLGNHEENNVQNKIIELMGEFGIRTGRIFISDEVPPGSGLGSSSALITALLKIIHELRGEEITNMELAEEAYGRERDFFGITLGKQDPYAISVGGLKFMKFKGNEIRTEYFKEKSISEYIDERMLLVYSGRTRESSAILGDQVSKSKTGDQDTIKRLIQMKNIAEEMHIALIQNNFPLFYNLINQGWNVKKNLGKNVSSEKIESIISRSMSMGAKAARLLGGGNQGFVLIMAEPDKLTSIQMEMTKISTFVTRISTSPLGTRIVR